MLKRSVSFFIVCFFLLCAGSATAQPYFDILTIHSIISPERSLTDSKKNPSAIKYFSAQIGIPFQLNKDVLLVNPFIEQYSLKLQSGTTKTTTVGSVGIPITFLKQWKDSTWKTAFIFIPRINSEIRELTLDNHQFGGAVLAIYEKKENLKFKLGLYYNKEFFGNFFMPLAGIDWNINPRLNLFGVLPGNLAFEYKFNSLLYGGINFKCITNSYRFNGSSYLKVSDNYLKLFLDYYIAEKFVITIEAGHTMLRKYTTSNTNEDFVQNSFHDGLLMKAGISYRIRLDKKN
jgi:hypothetical protein